MIAAKLSAFNQHCWLEFQGGAAYNIKIWKNNKKRHWHHVCVSVPKDRQYDLLAQTSEVICLLGTQPGPK